MGSRLSMTVGLLLSVVVLAAPEVVASEAGDGGRLAYHLDSWIALLMIVVAVGIAVMVNAAAPGTRTWGTVLAAGACFAAVLWFAALLPTGILDEPKETAFPTDPLKPGLLWILTFVTLAGGVLLSWAVARQRRRSDQLALERRNDDERFGLVSRTLHWTMAILFLAMIPMGIFMSIIPEDVAYRQGYYVVHKTIGIVLMLLALARLIWHWVTPTPPLEKSLRTWEKVLAKTVHYGLYFLMIALPVTGGVMSTYAGKSSHFFFWDLPPLWGEDLEAVRPWGLFHKLVLPYLFFLVFAGHLLGALKHHFLDKHADGIHRIAS